MIVVLTVGAVDDLDDAERYLWDHVGERATALIEEIRRRCAGLATFPERHPLCPRQGHQNVRRMVTGNYIVYYRVAGDRVEILRIVHGARTQPPDVDI